MKSAFKKRRNIPIKDDDYAFIGFMNGEDDEYIELCRWTFVLINDWSGDTLEFSSRIMQR